MEDKQLRNVTVFENIVQSESLIYVKFINYIL